MVVEVVLEVLLAAVLLLVAVAGGLLLRRRYLSAPDGSFELALRDRPRGDGRGWALGIGRYGEDDVLWFALFSWRLRPQHVISRRDLEIVSRRSAEPDEVRTISGDAVVLVGCDLGRTLELAMAPGALTGFLSWLESSPPGRHLDVA